MAGRINTNEYIQKLAQARQEHPEWRLGQACFNVLYELDPELADEVRGTDNDPFNDDNRYRLFIRWLCDGRLA